MRYNFAINQILGLWRPPASLGLTLCNLWLVSISNTWNLWSPMSLCFLSSSSGSYLSTSIRIWVCIL